jgi:hypothetical protein
VSRGELHVAAMLDAQETGGDTTNQYFIVR